MKRGLERPVIPSMPPALGKYSGQAVANTLLTVVGSLLMGTRMSSHTEKGVGEEKNSVCQPKMGDKREVQDVCAGTCPKASRWSFNLLWHASLLLRGQKEDCVAA